MSKTESAPVEGIDAATQTKSAVAAQTRETTAAAMPSLALLEHAENLLSAELATASKSAPNTSLKRLSILLPFHNERWTLPDVLQRLAELELPVECEIIAVDDGSTDGSSEVVQQWSEQFSRLRLVASPVNQGKGTAIRRAIEEMTGDIAVIQDADLEYDPADLPRLLRPILENRADAVFGTRFGRREGLCRPTWHTFVNRGLTLASNMITGVRLSDMETGYKVIRGDLLRELRLASHSFTLEPEITCRLAQWGARIYEVPIRYQGRSVEEGKKIRPLDGLKALWTLFHRRWIDTQYSSLPSDAALRARRHLHHYHRWLASQLEPHLGDRLLDAGAGTGSLSSLLLGRPRVVLSDIDSFHVERLEQRWGRRGNIRIEQAELEDREFAKEMQAEALDTILCAHTLEQIGADFLALRNCYEMLQPGGRLVVLAAANPQLWSRLDANAGHQRRYTPAHLEQLFDRAGFEITHLQPLNRLSGAARWVSGNLLGARQIGSLRTIGFDQTWRAAQHVDRFLPAPAANVLIVGQKPTT